MTAHSTDILWLKTVTKEDAYHAGEQTVHLGAMLQSGLPIPDGFVITSFAYFHFLKDHKLIPKINQLLTTINYEHPESVMQVATHIQKLIATTKFSDTFIADVTKSYNKLSGFFKNMPVSVHVIPTHTSSSLQQTFPTVHGDTNLMLKIQQAWVSLFSPTRITDRHARQLDHFQEGVAVLIQKMINAEQSGTMMTIDPVTQEKTKLIIEVVNGTTDYYIIDKTTPNNEILQKNIAGKQQKITDKQLQELADFGKKLEKHLYFPQEVNWAIEKNTIYIVQTKPLHTHRPNQTESTISSKLPLLLKGIPVSGGIATGRVNHIRQTKDVEKILHGDILVATRLPTDQKQFLKKAAAIITDTGGRTSHAALLARELGIPAIVSAVHATTNLKPGHIITVDATNGTIYQGSIASISLPRQTVTRTFSILTDLQNNTDIHADGTILHPDTPVPDLTKTLTTICERFGSRPVLYRIPDPLPKAINPLIGFRGTYRLLHELDSFKQDLEAIKKVKSKLNLKNLAMLLPFVRSVHELASVKYLMNEFGLFRSATFDLWIELAVPSTIMLLDAYIKAGIDGLMIDIDTLSMLLLGTDKDNSEVSHAYDPLDPAILHTLEKVIKTAHMHGIQTAIYGQVLLYHPSLIEKLVSLGITTIAVAPQQISHTKTLIIETERRLIENRALATTHEIPYTK